MKRTYILIIGCTGVGKSFIIDKYKSIIECEFGNEFIKVYTDPYKNNPFIEKAYIENQYVFQSQVFFLKEFLKIHKEINKLTASQIFQERSIFESVYIFCKQYYKNNIFTKSEYLLCENLLDTIFDFIRLPDLIINVEADISTILDRIKQRNRYFENHINETFVCEQQYLYKEFIRNFADVKNIPVINLNNNLNVNIDNEIKRTYNYIKNTN